MEPIDPGTKSRELEQRRINSICTAANGQTGRTIQLESIGVMLNKDKDKKVNTLS